MLKSQIMAIIMLRCSSIYAENLLQLSYHRNVLHVISTGKGLDGTSQAGRRGGGAGTLVRPDDGRLSYEGRWRIGGTEAVACAASMAELYAG